MRLSTIIIICALILVLGDLFDSGTTAFGLLNPIFAGQFVEVGDPFIMLFMYDLGLPQVTGFVIGLALSWSLDVLIVYWAWHNSRSYRPWGFDSWLLVIMVLLGVEHWIAGYQNFMLIYSA
jgi:hypothetical protein